MAKQAAMQAATKDENLLSTLQGACRLAEGAARPLLEGGRARDLLRRPRGPARAVPGGCAEAVG
eukprot:3735616-Pyramimonas_sp.AAC.1